MSETDLRQRLVECADHMDRLIAEHFKSCEPGSRVFPSGIDPYIVRDSNGRLALADLLIAQAQALAAIASLTTTHESPAASRS